ncbi:MAG: CHAD domain-containing protein, partial [Deinococcus-Thermus bacterium]|nr:CHAD domain-containing protein [Deinococcota bacterium]
MVDSSDPSLAHFAAEALSAPLASLLEAAGPVRDEAGPDDVARMHDAGRRLAVVLDVFAEVLPPRRHKRWIKHARRITDALDPVCQLDRQIRLVDDYRLGLEQPGRATGIKRLHLRLTQQRRRAGPQLAKALDKLAGADLARRAPARLQQRLVQTRLDGGPPDAGRSALRDHARAAVIEQLDELLAHEPIVAQPHMAQGLHQMRHVARRLGETLDLFAPLFDASLDMAVHDLQRVHAALADLHDTDQLIAMVGPFIEAERRRTAEFFGHLRGFAAVERHARQFREDRIGRRELQYERLTGLWRELRQKGSWT